MGKSFLGKMTDSLNSKLSSDLDIQTVGEYEGEWNLEKVSNSFTRFHIRKPSYVNKSAVKVTESLSLSSIEKLELLSDSKSISTAIKGAVIGGLAAGPVGAAVGGGLTALNRFLLVEIHLAGGNKLYGKMRQDVYEYFLVYLRSKTITDVDVPDTPDDKVTSPQKIEPDPLSTLNKRDENLFSLNQPKESLIKSSEERHVSTGMRILGGLFALWLTVFVVAGIGNIIMAIFK